MQTKQGQTLDYLFCIQLIDRMLANVSITVAVSRN